MRDGEEPAQPIHVEGDEFTFDTMSLDPPRATSRALPDILRGPHGRALTLAATTLLVVVVVVSLFARATSDPSSAIATLLRLPTATPAAPLPLNAGVIYASNGAPWGTLTIDGKRMPTAYLLGSGFAATRGVHHLAYQARYFPSLRCVFSVPRAPSDTCPLDTSAAAGQFLLNQGLARVLNLGSTGATLQSDQRDALIQLTNDALAAQVVTATIAPGDRYLDGQGQIVTANAPLHFTLSLALDGAEAPGVDNFCVQLCPDPILSSGGQLNNQLWPVRVIATSYWAITDASGRRLTPLTYLAGQPFPGSLPVNVDIQLAPDGWMISGLGQQNTRATINAALAMVSQVIDAEGGGGYGSAAAIDPGNPLEGCVLDVTFRGQTPRLFWRFGALLAVDSISHKLFPHLPVATAAERALANRIAPRPGNP